MSTWDDYQEAKFTEETMEYLDDLLKEAVDELKAMMLLTNTPKYQTFIHSIVNRLTERKEKLVGLRKELAHEKAMMAEFTETGD